VHAFRKSLRRTVAASLAVIVAVADWGAHQPRRWQQAQTARLPQPVGEWLLAVGNAAADVTDSAGLTGTDVTARIPQMLQTTNSPAWDCRPVRRPDSPLPNDIVVLSKTGFTVGYSPSLRHPVWVAYRMRPALCANIPARPSEFKPDPAAPRSPAHKDYTKSGYDRGHMAPNRAIAASYGKAAQVQTFQTSNICPQRPSLNQGPWCNLEFRIAELWPERYGDIWVVTGTIPSSGRKRLPSGVDIPSAFYQIVIAREKDRLRAFAVCMPQNVRRRTYARAMIVSIDEVEALCGLDFLSALPDDIENALESGTPTRLWPTGPIGVFRLLGERFRRYD